MKRAVWAVLGLFPTLAGADTPFRLGVQTHFEQGWTLDWVDRAAEVKAPLVRDEVDWAAVEPSPGRYDFALPDAYMSRLAKAGIGVLIVQTDTNPLYDGGQTPFTPEGRQALAGYLAALARHYPDQVLAWELGNEVNAGDSTSGPFEEDAPAGLAATARAVASALPDDGSAPLLCAGTNTFALGFLRRFFLRGGLQSCDAISVHPYGSTPETVDLELARLRAMMRELGGEVPIHVTEFGQWTDRPEDSAEYMVKMTAVLASQDVADAIWYALADEPWWPNMGLFDSAGQIKPAGRAFRFLQDRILPLGRPIDRSPTRSARIMTYGGGQAVVAWGAELPVRISGEDVQAFDATGSSVPVPDRLHDAPVILLGAGIAVEITGPPVADSLFSFDQPPFGYFALRPGTGLTPLEQRDWDWATFRGAPDLSPLSITASWITTARFAEGPFAAVERFTAVDPGRYRIDAWWESADAKEPVEVTILLGGATVLQGSTASGRFAAGAVEVTLNGGDTLDFQVSPLGPGGDGATRRRIRIEGPLP